MSLVAPPVFDLPCSLIPARVSVNTTNPPAIKHRHDRIAVPLFWYSPPPPPFFVPIPLFHFALRSSRSVFSPRFYLSLPLPSFLSLFCKTTASMRVREQPVWIATALRVQHRIINYSRAVARVFEFSDARKQRDQRPVCLQQNIGKQLKVPV